MLGWLLEDGRIALLAVIILLVELPLARRIAGPAAPSFAANVVAGLGLTTALYAALAGWHGATVVAGMALGLAGHLAQLILALRR